MLFDIVLLRSEGRRRLRVDVLRDVPIREDISTEDTGARYGVVATLKVAGAVMARMERVTIGRVVTSSLVLAGVEVLNEERHVQEWWCRQGEGGPPRPYDADTPSVVERDPSYAPA